MGCLNEWNLPMQELEGREGVDLKGAYQWETMVYILFFVISLVILCTMQVL